MTHLPPYHPLYYRLWLILKHFSTIMCVTSVEKVGWGSILEDITKFLLFRFKLSIDEVIGGILGDQIQILALRQLLY